MNIKTAKKELNDMVKVAAALDAAGMYGEADAITKHMLKLASIEKIADIRNPLWDAAKTFGRDIVHDAGEGAKSIGNAYNSAIDLGAKAVNGIDDGLSITRDVFDPWHRDENNSREDRAYSDRGDASNEANNALNHQKENDIEYYTGQAHVWQSALKDPVKTYNAMSRWLKSLGGTMPKRLHYILFAIKAELGLK